MLSSSEGNILEDETAINVISSSKVLSNDIAQKQVIHHRHRRDARRLCQGADAVFAIGLIVGLLAEREDLKQVIAEKTEKKIDEARMGYKAVACHVSVLFFTISELASIEPMYQYSLTWFVNLFDDTIAKSEKSKDLHKRIDVSALTGYPLVSCAGIANSIC